MEHFAVTELAPIVALVQLFICLAASAVVCLLHKFAPKAVTVRWILITMIIGSGWSAIANYGQTQSLYIGVLVFMISVLAMLVWVIWFHVWHLPEIETKKRDQYEKDLFKTI